MRGAYRALLDRPAVVLSNNSHGGAADYADWLGIEPEAIEVVYNGVDLTDLQPPPQSERTAFRAELGIDAKAPLVGGMFRFSAEKRPLLWLDAAALIARQWPTARFLLFGEGPLRPEMERRIAASGLTDRLRLLPPTANIALALSAFDLLLLTSQWEGTPNVAIEAQAAGTPVVLTGGGGAKEAIADGTTGIYVEKPDPHAIANATVRMISDAERIADGVAQDFVNERFAMERMIARTCELYGLQ
jgi:glycosyltransferase involved in cell wall biosynthesis